MAEVTGADIDAGEDVSQAVPSPTISGPTTASTASDFFMLITANGCRPWVLCAYRFTEHQSLLI
jgi:hypothetical protein